MRYHIVFSGELKPGVSRDETIARLAKLSGSTPQQAEQRFFSGKRVRLKSFEDKASAERLVEKLFAAGLIATVVEQGSDPVPQATQPVTSSVAPSPPTAEAQSSRPRKSRKVAWSIGLAASLIVALGGAAFWYASSLLDTSVPAIVQRAENTLLNGQAVLLGHANVQQMVKLEQVAMGRQASDVRPNPDDESFLNELLVNGINLRQDLQQLVFSLNVDPTHGSYLSAVLATTADPEVIRRFLQKNYELEIENREGLEVLTFRKLDREWCRYSEAHAAILGDGLMVISHPAKVVSVYRTLMETNGTTPLNQQWVDYRSQRLLSLGIFEPDRLEDERFPGAAGFLLMGLRSQWQSMDSIFAGARGSLVPPALSVDLTVTSRDDRWVADSKLAIQQHLDELDADSADFASLLLSKVSVEGNAQSIGTVFTVDTALVDAGKQAFQEGMAGFVTSMGGSFGNQGDEVIDEDPQVYLANLPAADLPAFENRFNEVYQWSQGPLAARVNSVAINRDGLTTLELMVESGKIPNAPNSSFGKLGEVRVNDVVGAAGNSLLQVETCGSELNQDPAHFDFNNRATKRVRLKPGKTLADVAAIQAQVSLHVPAQTRAERLALPLSNDVFEQDDSYLRIQEVKDGQLNFVLSGARGGFLNLRALNAKQQYLASGAGASFGSSINKSFRGDIHSLELIRALSYHEQRFPIQLNTTNPPHKEGGFAQEAAAPVTYDSDDWSEVLRLAGEQVYEPSDNGWRGQAVATTRSGPAELSLFGPEVSRSIDGHELRAYAQVQMPYVKALEAKHGRVRLEINQLQLSGEDGLMRHSTQPVRLTFRGFGNNYKDTSKSEAELRKGIYLTGDLDLKVPVPDSERSPDDRSLESLSGELVFTLPTAVSSRVLSPVRLGERLQWDGFALQVVGIAADSISLQLTGDDSQLLAVQLLDADDKLLGEGIEFREESGRSGVKPNHREGEEEAPPRTLGQLTFFSGEPAKLAVFTTPENATQRYPVELVIGGR